MSQRGVILIVVVWLGQHPDLLGGKMKRILLLTIATIIFICSACNNSGKEASMVKYETGVFHDKNWDEQVGSYQNEVIPDKETALAIATQIFKSMKKSPAAQEYTPQYVYYDKEDAIWIVSFWKESDAMTLGGDCSIAMQKKDGKVLRIWFGE